MGTAHQPNWLQGRTSCDPEELFLTNCVTTRAVGLWAAEVMGLTGAAATAYAEQLVIDFVRPGPLDIVEKLRADFLARGLEVSPHRIAAAIDRERNAAQNKVVMRVWSKKPGDGGWERRIFPRFMIPPMRLPPVLKRWLARHKDEPAGTTS